MDPTFAELQKRGYLIRIAANLKAFGLPDPKEQLVIVDPALYLDVEFSLAEPYDFTEDGTLYRVIGYDRFARRVYASMGHFITAYAGTVIDGSNRELIDFWNEYGLDMLDVSPAGTLNWTLDRIEKDRDTKDYRRSVLMILYLYNHFGYPHGIEAIPYEKPQIACYQKVLDGTLTETAYEELVALINNDGMRDFIHTVKLAREPHRELLRILGLDY